MNGKAKIPILYTTVQTSYFDICDNTAAIYKSDMRGFYIMYILISSTYVVISACSKYTEQGFTIESKFFKSMMIDGSLIICLWIGVFSYCWLAYLLQMLIINGLNNKLSLLFQHLTQSIVFIFVFALGFTRNWGFTQTLFSLLLALTHFMKMHSYTLTNRDLRESKSKVYPNNINIKNFLHYMIAPTLVYQIEYSSRPSFRKGYFIKKLILFTVQFWSLYNVISDCVLPVLTEIKELNYLEGFCRLIFPVLICYLMLFFILFEQILNMFAEIVKFGDREFYQDWWNSSSFEEFNRKWNRPVHLFLHKHIYLECVKRYGFSEHTAKAVTFVFSAACHEMVLASICRSIKPYLLGLMLIQIPLILLQRLLNRSLLGLYVFWGGMIAGLPLLLTLYTKYV
ncbi:hypothetical protein SteCoe_22127 [Stentor coeruleus]|uniref:O-acyltransferase n=1 Tax=Stentor coeruleus TaxID=5963 RepID=A0A1R2BK04_9CILI|nr:hypothetical protein SteCoe_23400 [Stentor coeruleus]OMJ78113.1 hypothetical protein SteCoe_22127 [Stentor coeruleus]